MLVHPSKVTVQRALVHKHGVLRRIVNLSEKASLGSMPSSAAVMSLPYTWRLMKPSHCRGTAAKLRRRCLWHQLPPSH